MLSYEDLRKTLARIDGRGYKAYKDLEGAYRQDQFILFVDHVQGDPFAAPSKIRVRVPQAVAKVPKDFFKNRVRRVAAQDYFTRKVHRCIQQFSAGHRGMGKSGLMAIDVGGQEVLDRTALVLKEDWVEARLHVGLPAAGRTVLGRQAETMLCGELPTIVTCGLFWEKQLQEEAWEFVECIENQEHIRGQLETQKLVGFIGDGAILPRASGASDKPLVGARVQAFQAPELLRVTVTIPNSIKVDGKVMDTVTGMGIPQGVTLMVGGGYHGKSTVLRALERCVYPHIPGDGREYVVTTSQAVKVRAEDGRRIEQVNISGFIKDLPFGQNTTQFSTTNASGSTSQAATIIEAVEMGTTAILLDEDTSATNFMVRDARMQALVEKAYEPITPFVDRVRELYERFGVSTVLVMGGCGDYFDVADTVIMMRNYLPVDVTKEAHHIAKVHHTQRRREVASALPNPCHRVPVPETIDPSRGRREVKIDVKALDVLMFGQETLQLRAVEQLVDVSQTRAVGYAIYLAAQRFMDGKAELAGVLKEVEALLRAEGLDVLDPFRRSERHPGNFARPRSYEIAAAINRLRTLRLEPKG